MAETLSALDFLARAQTAEVPPICVLFGDEPFLKHESLARLRSAVLTGDDGEISFSTFDGDEAELREVLDELATVSMFGGGRRMVLIDDAGEFVSNNREALEEYCQKPRASSVLVLSVDSWPANTRLYKRVAEMGLQINCNLPSRGFGDVDETVVLKWLRARVQSQHHSRLTEDAAELLLEIVGPQLGRLDQELTKLALLAGDKIQSKPETKSEGRGTINRELVEQAVGGWRAKTAWAMIEAALDGNAAVALVELDRLLLAGEEPIALLAMMSGSLRRLASAARLVQQAEIQRRRITLQDALKTAGVTPKKFVLEKSERQLRQITRHRAKHLLRWLLEADLALKGASSSHDRARLVLEQLIVRLSKQFAPKSPAVS